MAYADRTDFTRLGLPAGALTSVPTDSQDAQLAAASSFVDGYLAKRFTLPLSAWGDDVTRATCAVAAWDSLTVRGFNPNSPADVAVRMRYEDIVRWLEKVASGAVVPQGIVDATPTVRERRGAAVVSRPRRGW